ncbi:Golgi-associated plant pathogenesis-related protein 1 isoform X2 [Exaiptasia diaphana]|nr:Golgi-associated plant pathogenesis-related protein 1 isoform X2 [Exaiptasia diaphana]XP_020908987.1 Golgi-associated plant pathogenesis-related protein 1 isoform X2 [Exaiptasia diaphana]XP_020908988.1 Golgi-associated plant pathogenesis-related protein 1 isoform X2 [Exaiptasia diaphana]
MDSFTKKSLDAHNKYRSQHNVPLLTWSSELAREAQAWAKNIAKKNKLMHAKDRKSGEGENIFMSSSADFDDAGADATDSWYSEVKNYNFKKGGYQPNTGHFTQVVWKSSSELGMARSKAKNGCVYVVARYKPGGNMMNEFDENVLPKVSSGESSPDTNNKKNISKEKQESERTPGESNQCAKGKQEMAPVHVNTTKPSSYLFVG